MRGALLVAGSACLLVGLFYAFNAYIQLAERGFVEALDLPIAIVGVVAGSLLVWLARRPGRVTPRS